MKRTTITGCLVTAVVLSACGDNGPPTTPGGGGPDFERVLAPGDYQVSVGGDFQRAFERTGATFRDYQNGPGSAVTILYLWDDFDALDGAQFDVCPAPLQRGTYAFDAVTPSTECPLDLARVAGGFIIQLGAPQDDELDCYPNGYGNKSFGGTLAITSVTANEIEGEAQGSGTCSRHPHSEITPMHSADVSVRIRFRAIRWVP
jgi:hypothetical protein